METFLGGELKICGLDIPVRRRRRTLDVCPTATETWKEVKCVDNASQLMRSGLGDVREGASGFGEWLQGQRDCITTELTAQRINTPTHSHTHTCTSTYAQDKNECIFLNRAALRHIIVMV